MQAVLASATMMTCDDDDADDEDDAYMSLCLSLQTRKL
jgi:hypothetical protein